MNTNKVSIAIPAGVALVGATFLALVSQPANYLPALAVLVSYVSVGILMALAASDYRSTPRHRL